MDAILIGVAAFVAAYFFDLASFHRVGYAKRVTGLLVVLLGSYSHLAVNTQGDAVALPTGLPYAGGLLFCLAAPALLYSLFLEIPFTATYIAERGGTRLVTTGTYALTRHPGVLWYTLLLISFVLMSGRILAFLAAPVWLLMDILYVWIQERFFFTHMFPDYEQYKQETPMLIPNRKSIVRCLRTLPVGRKSPVNSSKPMT